MIRPTDSPLLFIEFLGGQIPSFNTLASRAVPATAIIIPISSAISRYYLHTGRYINPSIIGFCPQIPVLKFNTPEKED